MQFNPSKCNIICISNEQRPPQRSYFFWGSKLKQVDSASYLGITVNSKLKWSEHIPSISSKANRSLRLIKRNLWNCPRKISEMAYTSIVWPKLEYASASWDPHYKKVISTLERVQRKAARFCLQNFNKKQQVWQRCYLCHTCCFLLKFWRQKRAAFLWTLSKVEITFL